MDGGGAQEEMKQLAQRQFAASADAYATSSIHAKGRSLARLVEILQPQAEWKVCDVATAAGHTAHAFAPHVRLVVASDITLVMLRVAAEEALKKNLTNVIRLVSDAERLPFGDQLFDLVTCRIAAHHFPDVEQFLRESARILRPGGRLAVVDNVVPGSVLGGKRSRQLRDTGRYVNALEKLRDPSHVRCLCLEEWQLLFFQAGFRITLQETQTKMLELDDWSSRMKVPVNDNLRLRVMLRQAPEAVKEFLAPKFEGSRVTFNLTEAILVGIKDGP